MKFSWQPPSNPNGNVTHYIVAGRKHRNANIDNLINERDYCNVRSYRKFFGTKMSTILINKYVYNCYYLAQNTPKQIVHPNPQVISPNSNNNNNDSCSCDDNKESTISINEAEEISRIKFEDELQNEVYIKKFVYS